MCIAEDYKHMHVYLSVKKQKKINHSKNFAKLFNYLLLVEFLRKICKTKKSTNSNCSDVSSSSSSVCLNYKEKYASLGDDDDDS